ncbi:MAG: ZIP family metal transporter [Candidatus Diapherotrites archaeon]
MDALLWILAATIANSLVAFVGAFSLFISKEKLESILLALVGFSAGALLSGAFFHLLAESLEQLPVMEAFAYLFVGFIVFFLLERFLYWHHCHEGKCDVHAFSYMILFGDAMHNFIDGLVIAASFLVNSGFGIVTTLIIIGHELPQELGDFGVMVFGGMERKKALFYNFVAQMASILGGILGFFFIGGTGIVPLLLPFAAGGFIYIGASDLIPQLHKEKSFKKYFGSFAFFLAGIAFMVSIKILVGA